MEPQYPRSLEQATNFFLAYSPLKSEFKKRYTLERMTSLMNHLGNPQDDLRVIHIAGTSGKTSTAYFIRGLLEATGQKTGLTVSPHIVAINERVQIAGRPLEEKKFLEYLRQYIEILSDFADRPTYFELVMSFAYFVFAKEKVSYAVIETGLGGGLAASNVARRKDKISVLTHIGLDHTEILGDTLSKIAFQKAGIIANRNKVFAISQNEIVLKIFREESRVRNADLQIVQVSNNVVSNMPLFQNENWSLANAVADYCIKRDQLKPLSSDDRKHVLSQTPPGRYEKYYYKDRIVILDGAHNPQKLDALVTTLEKDGVKSIDVLFSLSDAPENKLIDSLAAIAPVVNRLIITSFILGQDSKIKYNASLSNMQVYAERVGIKQIDVIKDYSNALHKLLEYENNYSLVTGSLYLVSVVRPELRRLCGITEE